MIMRKESLILCECGHSLSSHAIGAEQCYASMRRTERKKNHLEKYIRVKCFYNCYCKKFKQLNGNDENEPQNKI